MTLEEAAVKLHEAKIAENEANKARIQAEELLISMIEVKEKGSVTVEAGDHIKATVTTGLSYKCDVAEVNELCNELGLKAPLKTQPAKTVLDDKAYEKIRETDTAFFKRLSEVITVTPKKPSVTLKLV